ncbi:hypothetical protein EQV77_06340 [Halobacillus fulvus]|nr:hypothetical protein EQV77_06340 [Halobacillus fulvus]
MSFKKRLVYAIAFAVLMSAVSLTLSYLDQGKPDINHLIGVSIAGVITGFWIMPHTFKKSKRKKDE